MLLRTTILIAYQHSTRYLKVQLAEKKEKSITFQLRQIMQKVVSFFLGRNGNVRLKEKKNCRFL